MLKRTFLFIWALTICGVANASTYTYVDWTSSTATTATGSLFGSITVSYSGEIAFTQTSSGTNFWSPTGTFTTATISNGPPNSDIVAIDGTATTHTVTFSSPVTDVIMDILSLGQPGLGTQYIFNQPFSIVQIGPSSAFGGGTTTLTQSGNTLTGHEGDGVLLFSGPISSITWTGANPEFWNGFTFGALSVATSGVPEPATSAFTVIGLLGFIAATSLNRHRKS